MRVPPPFGMVGAEIFISLVSPPPPSPPPVDRYHYGAVVTGITFLSGETGIYETISVRYTREILFRVYNLYLGRNRGRIVH